jgi:hypothetical protein
MIVIRCPRCGSDQIATSTATAEKPHLCLLCGLTFRANVLKAIAEGGDDG